MLSPDAKAIWKSKAGAGLMAALLGQQEPDAEAKKAAAELARLSAPVPDLAADEALRAQGLPTVPTSIGLERQSNPFLRVNQSAVRAALAP